MFNDDDDPSSPGEIITDECLEEAAERLAGSECDPNYDLDNDIRDLRQVGVEEHNVRLQRFAWWLATYFRARDNGALAELKRLVAQTLAMRPNVNRTILHGIAYAGGVTDPTTVSLWVRAAPVILAKIGSTTDIIAVTKRLGGIRNCADQARGNNPNKPDAAPKSNSPAPTSPSSHKGDGGGAKAGTKSDDFENSANLGGNRQTTTGTRPPAIRASQKDQGNDSHDGGPYIDVRFSDKAHKDFKAVLAGKAPDAVARITHHGNLALYADTVSCATCPRSANLIAENDDFEDQ